jgi:lipopolysaccharide/colanic/teichoic acid biosynthesis glycosyltransferase
MGVPAVVRPASETEMSAAAGRAIDEPGRARSNGIYARFGKRALDVLLILIVAPAAAPVIALLALLARLDGGPAFYGQARIGRGGRLFTCWKIRTMVPDAEARLEAHLAACPKTRAEWERNQKLRDDPRVTAFGAFLRSTSLDELPQVWNILAGHMSLVGPRPFTPEQMHLYQGRSYFDLRPGLTGPWQVSERNDGSFAGRAVHDAKYARELSLALDLALLLRTVRVVVMRTGR